MSIPVYFYPNCKTSVISVSPTEVLTAVSLTVATETVDHPFTKISFTSTFDEAACPIDPSVDYELF